MAHSDESFCFVKQVFPDDDPSEATLRRTGPNSSGLPSGRRRRMWQATTATLRLIDEEDEAGGRKGKYPPPRRR
ncbi:UNVERIFIED_CONTAM: hypothetical protein Slati_3504200 [Sesamum latifolium]|uniref:Uncharacterized protein n=1 Tax=Sesamum latifolium TaxID=2727402 RepID=A0AAW2UIX1_9LAMI